METPPILLVTSIFLGFVPSLSSQVTVFHHDNYHDTERRERERKREVGVFSLTSISELRMN
jgi:hypothetical protein